jgi:hypothetical protein
VLGNVPTKINDVLNVPATFAFRTNVPAPGPGAPFEMWAPTRMRENNKRKEVARAPCVTHPRLSGQSLSRAYMRGSALLLRIINAYYFVKSHFRFVFVAFWSVLTNLKYSLLLVLVLLLLLLLLLLLQGEI